MVLNPFLRKLGFVLDSKKKIERRGAHFSKTRHVSICRFFLWRKDLSPLHATGIVNASGSGRRGCKGVRVHIGPHWAERVGRVKPFIISVIFGKFVQSLNSQKVLFSSWKNLCSNMIITTRNPSYPELLGLFTVHTNVSTNARLSLQLW